MEFFIQFIEHNMFGQRLLKVFDVFTPEQVLTIIKTYNQNEAVFSALLSFVKKYKTAVKFTAEDLQELEKLLQVKNVMES